MPDPNIIGGERVAWAAAIVCACILLYGVLVVSRVYIGRMTMDEERSPKSMEPLDMDALLGIASTKQRHRERFKLVEIAFEKTLEVQIQFADPNEMGRGIVKLADAALTAMEKTPDTGPSAGEQPALKRIRDALQDRFYDLQKLYEKTPTQDEGVLAARHGLAEGHMDALKFIDAEMEKTGEVKDA